MESYSSYKDSEVEWIGTVPLEWTITKMKYVGKYFNGYPFKPSDWGDIGRLIIRIQNLTKGKGTENFYDGEIDERYIVRKGDYLFSWSTTLGLFEWEKEESILNQHIFKVELNDSLIKKYYFWVVQGLIKELHNESHGSTMTHLTKDVFGNISLPKPTSLEQTQIVSFLDTKTQKIDELIEKTEQKIKLLKEKRTSLINHCVTKGLNPNVEMKDSGVEWIGEIPRDWEFIPLKNICYMKGRIGWKGLKQDEFLDDGDYYLITGHDIKNDRVDWNKCYHISKERYDESPEIMLEEQDLLFTKDGTIGKTLLIENLPKPTSLNSHLLVIRPTNNRYISKFLQYVFKSVPFLVYVEHNKTGTTFYGVSQNTMMNFRGIFPPLSEQTQIVEYLDEQTQKINSTIEKETQRIELLKEYRQSLISEVVTGKVDVRDWKE